MASSEQQMKGWHAGDGIALARRRADMSQTELAEKLEAESGLRWNAAKVSRLEIGSQEMTVSELQLVSKVQDRDVEWYLVGPESVSTEDLIHLIRGSSIGRAADC